MNTRARALPIRRLLLLSAAAAVLAASVPQTAAAHRNGSWMFPQEIMLRLEARGYALPMCRGLLPIRYRGSANPSYAQFRHFECLVTSRAGTPNQVFCVHTLPGKRLKLSAKPLGHTCRF